MVAYAPSFHAARDSASNQHPRGMISFSSHRSLSLGSCFAIPSVPRQATFLMLSFVAIFPRRSLMPCPRKDSSVLLTIIIIVFFLFVCV